MSIFDEIKGERSVTMEHWRYRLLHWVFGVENAIEEGPSEDLPDFLYKYWCPLFWLTNLLAILLPFILLATLIKQLVISVGTLVFRAAKITGTVIVTVIDGIATWYRKVWPINEEEQKRLNKIYARAAKQSEEKFQYENNIRRTIKSINDHLLVNENTKNLEYIKNIIDDDFINNRFTYVVGYSPEEEQTAQVKQYFNSIVDRLEEKKRRKEVRTARIIKVLAIVEPVFKIGVLIVGVVLAIGALAGLVYISPLLVRLAIDAVLGLWGIAGEIWSFVVNFSIGAFFWWAIKWFGTVLFATILITLFVMYLGPPLRKKFGGAGTIVVDVVSESSGWVSDIFGQTAEFFMMMYKNNCPKITIEKPVKPFEEE